MTEAYLLLDDDLNEDLINLHHRSPDDIMPILVRNARLEAHTDGSWHHLASLKENCERRRVLRLDAPVHHRDPARRRGHRRRPRGAGGGGADVRELMTRSGGEGRTGGVAARPGPNSRSRTPTPAPPASVR